MSPRDLVCGNCNAQPGKRCTQPTNTGRVAVNWYHFAREQAFRDLPADRANSCPA